MFVGKVASVEVKHHLQSKFSHARRGEKSIKIKREEGYVKNF